MADDIHELLDVVESKYNDSEDIIHSSSFKKSGSPVAEGIYPDGTEEIHAAIHSICGVPASIQTVISQNDSGYHHLPPNRSGGVMFVRNASSEVGLPNGTSCRRNSSYRRQRPNSTASTYNKRIFTKPVFELSVKDLEAERARRKQKEIIERLFERKEAMVVPKIILDERKYKRIKSNVWKFFGDVRLFISETESKGFNIDCNVIHINGEEYRLCKSFVACVACCAVFSYESHSYGTSTLRSHLKSCGKPRFNRKDKGTSRTLDQKQLLDEIPSYRCKDDPYDMPWTGLEEQRTNFRDESFSLQKQITMFLLSGQSSFENIRNPELQKLLQMCIKIGSVSGKIDLQHILCSKDQLAGNLIQKLYDDSVAGFTSDMKNVYGISFSFEIWKDIARHMSYLNILCYYSSDEGTFKSVIVHTTEFEYESKGGHDLSKVVFAYLNNTGLCIFKRMLVIDYSLNMHEAFGGERFIFCIWHCVSGMVQNLLYSLTTIDDDGNLNFPSFVGLINECRSLVLYFKNYKIQHDLPNYLHLCSSDWCWESVLMMLKSISDQWDHITDILRERGELELFDIDEQLINVVIDFLQIFQDGVAELTCTTHPTLNMVIPWWSKWKGHCLQKECELPFLAVLKSFMNTQIDEEIMRSVSLFHKLATMFDPRFKQLENLTEEDSALVRNEAEKLVKECEESFLQTKSYDDISCGGVSDPNKISVLQSDPQSQVNLGMCLDSSYEISNYLDEPYSVSGDDLDTQGRFNPLKYWARVKTRYPYLHHVASWILSCPASSLRNNERSSSENKWMVSVRDNEYPCEKMSLCQFSKSFKNL